MALIVVHKSPTVISTVEKLMFLLLSSSSSSLPPFLVKAETRLMMARNIKTAIVAHRNGHVVGRLPYSRRKLVMWVGSKAPWRRGEDMFPPKWYPTLYESIFVEELNSGASDMIAKKLSTNTTV
jgi:hypothetical protein